MSLNSITCKRTFLTLICLLVYSAIIPMHLSDYVLCIGEDGHIRIEYVTHADHGCCQDNTSHEHDHTEHESDHTDEDHCGNCLDIPIFACINTETTIITEAKNPITSHQSVSIVSPILHKESFISFPPTKSLTLFALLIDPTLNSLRTVSLLI